MFYQPRMCLVKEPEVGQWFWNYNTNKLCVMCENMKLRVFDDINDMEYDFDSKMLFNINFGYYDVEPAEHRVSDVIRKDGKRYYVAEYRCDCDGTPKCHIESMDDDEELDIDGNDDSYTHRPTIGEVREFKNKYNIPNWDFKPMHAPLGKQFSVKFNPDEFRVGEAYSITSPSICFHALLMHVEADVIRFIRARGIPIEFTMTPEMVKRYNIEMRLLKDDFNSI